MASNPPFLGLCCILVAVGCHDRRGTPSGSGGEESDASTVPSTGVGTDSSGSSSEVGSSGAPTTGELPAPDPYDLFQCGLEPDCLLSEDFFMSEPGLPSACAAQLVRSQKPGLMIVVPYAIPFCADWVRLLILRGDGTVLVQARTAYEEACEEQPDNFVAGPQQSCELDLPDDFAMLEEWFPVVKNCVDSEPLTCAGVLELLGE